VKFGVDEGSQRPEKGPRRGQFSGRGKDPLEKGKPGQRGKLAGLRAFWAQGKDPAPAHLAPLASASCLRRKL